MNLIVFKSEELCNGLLELRASRAEHLLKIIKVTEGSQLRVGLIGGMQGVGRVIKCDQNRVFLSVDIPKGEAIKPKIDIILALPRPQMLKRILQTVAALGVGSLALIRSARVEKSYFQSPILAKESLDHYIRLGMEQGMRTYEPKVRIYDRFMPFVEEELATMLVDVSMRVLGHVGENHIADMFVENNLHFEKRCIVAIGPEGGWQEHEVLAFKRSGFVPLSFSDAVMNVETAVTSVLSQFEILERVFGRRKA